MFTRVPVTWFPLLITGLQRQWTQWAQRRSLHVTSEASLGKRHGSPDWKGAVESLQTKASVRLSLVITLQPISRRVELRQLCTSSRGTHRCAAFTSQPAIRMCYDIYGPRGYDGVCLGFMLPAVPNPPPFPASPVPSPSPSMRPNSRGLQPRVG